MRVTDSRTYDVALATIQNNIVSMNRAQQQVSSGKRIDRPADDPTGASSATRLRASIADIDSFTRGIADARTWLNVQDTALQSASSLMARAKELATQAGNGAQNDTSRAAIATELDGIRRQLAALANTQQQGQAVFGGFTATAVELTDTSATFVGSPGGTSVLRQVSPEQVVTVNTDGAQVFGFDAGYGLDVFSALADLSTAVRAGDTDAIGASAATLDARADDIRSALGAVGSRSALVNGLEISLGDRKQALTEQRTSIEDADPAAAAIELTRASQAYEAALAAIARTSSISLLDFLR
jgi:flagellar hook-associated protein 3 FlgL